jgi:hypothetical protein
MVIAWFACENLDKIFGFDTSFTEDAGAFAGSLATLPVLLIFIVVFIPMHYTSQTKPVSFVIQDPIGNVSAAVLRYNGSNPEWQNWMGEGVDGKSWTDFFWVETTTDKYGFLHFWWTQRKSLF